MSTNARIRGRRLQERRERLLRAAPLCVRCEAEGRIRPATQLDHIVAIANGGSDTEDNLQGLCDECHKAKTDADFGRSQGCDADGVPLDPSHPWRRE